MHKYSVIVEFKRYLMAVCKGVLFIWFYMKVSIGTVRNGIL